MPNPIRSLLRSLFHLLSVPVFEDEDKTRAAGLLIAALRALLAVVSVASPLIVVLGTNALLSLGIGIFAVMMFLGLFALTHRGHVRLAGALLSLLMVVLVTASIVVGGGVDNPTTAAYMLSIAVAGLILGGRAAMVMTAISVLISGAIYYADASGWLKDITIQEQSGIVVWVLYVVIFVLVGSLLRLAARGINEALERARRNERAQIVANRELQTIRDSLEERVLERTAQLNVSAEVSRTITSVLRPDDLIRQVVQLITERFNYYYAAVFLVDDEGRYAMLREATGEAGQTLKERGHRLEIGGTSMVSAAIVTKQPRVASHAGDDPLRFANPLLPDTRSEVALPLWVGDHVLGALDVQSTQADAFDSSTLALLQNLADQIAIALNNARQFENAQREARQSAALFEASQLAGSSSENLASVASQLLDTTARQANFDAWAVLLVDADNKRYSLLASHEMSELSQPGGPAPATPDEWQPDAPTALAIRLRQPVVVNDPDIDPLLSSLPSDMRRALGKSVSVPALLDDRIVGAIRLTRALDHTSISQRDVQLAQAIASQLAVTIQNRQLLEQAQSSATELTLLMRRYTQEGWTRFGRSHQELILHEYSQPGAGPLDPDLLSQLDRVARTKTLTPVPVNGDVAIGVPIALRGEIIGTLGVQDHSAR